MVRGDTRRGPGLRLRVVVAVVVVAAGLGLAHAGPARAERSSRAAMR